MAISDCRPSPGLLGARLSDLLLELLVGVANTLVLVWVRLAQRAHIRRNLATLLPIDTRNRHMRLLRIDRNFNARRQLELDRVGVAERKHDRILTLHLHAVSNTNHVELLFPAIRHALNSVEDQRAR